MTHRVVIIAIFVAAIAVTPWMAFAASVPRWAAWRLNSRSLAGGYSRKSEGLSRQVGRLVLLPKDFTSGCTIEAHNFQRDQPRYQQKGAVVLGVSVPDADSHKQFCTKEGLSFKLLADTDHKVSSEYGSLTSLGLVKFASRHTFIINPEGKVIKVFTEVNPTSIVRKCWQLSPNCKNRAAAPGKALRANRRPYELRRDSGYFLWWPRMPR